MLSWRITALGLIVLAAPVFPAYLADSSTPVKAGSGSCQNSSSLPRMNSTGDWKSVKPMLGLDR